MQNERQKRNRTPGEAVHGLPMGGTKRIRTALAAVGILDLPGLSEAGTDPGSLPGDPGQETRMRREKLDDYYRTGKKGNQMSRLWMRDEFGQRVRKCNNERRCYAGRRPEADEAFKRALRK